MTTILTYGPMTARLLAERGAPEGLRPQDLDLVAAPHIDELYALRQALHTEYEDESYAVRCLEGHTAPVLRR